ncbi:MAG: hypothetical protein IJY99_00110 [Alphaproteobacteria bacterium]|nr:hypothetical protein [Alphaproteobacteria bacterium]
MKKTDIEKFFAASQKIQNLNPFQERLTPRYAIIDATKKELKEIENSTPASKRTAEFQHGIKLATELIETQRKIYDSVSNMRDLQLLTGVHDDRDDVEKFVDSVGTFMESLRSAQK